MGKIETFDHTADVGLRLWGDDPNDLFQTAAEALFDYVVVNRTDVESVEEESVSLKAESMGDLLIDWLSELIFRSETQHRLYSRFNVRVAEDGRSLKADIGGEEIDPDRHELDHEVKAVTRHGLVFRGDESGYFAEMILDI